MVLHTGLFSPPRQCAQALIAKSPNCVSSYPLLHYYQYNYWYSRAHMHCARVNWCSIVFEQFIHHIAGLNFSALYNCTSADEAYDTLMHLLKNAYHHCFKIETVRSSKKILKTLLTSECHERIHKKNALYYMFIKSRDSSDLAKFKKFRNTLNKTLRHKLNAYFLNPCERASSRSDILWQK